MPTADASGGNTSPSNTQGSFFKSLPLPRGSWRVGPNGHFWDCRSGCGRPHHGNDLHAKAGTPVFAVADGVVTRVKYNGGGYHWYIIIKHDATGPSGRRYNTLYGHIEVAQGLKVGQRVTAGQQIATVSAKKVRSPHCHFEVLRDDGSWKGTPLNPNAFARFHAPSEKAKVAYTRREPPLGRGVA
jgi:murein DD-endopeptidase MepM/ murein hydrolase activator NlpD